MYQSCLSIIVRQAVKEQELELSELQKKILKQLCMRKNADYKTLSKATDRDRITLLQSLQSLLKHRLVDKEAIGDDGKRIKLIFKPTDKGKIYASTSLGIDHDAIRNAQSDDNGRMRYDEFIKQVPNPAERKRNEKRVMEDLLRENLFQHNGNIPDMDKLLNQLLRVRLLAFVKSSNFDINELFTPVGMNTLRAISTPEEIEEFKKLLILLRKNLDSTIKSLSN
jgi:predicted transcriptional regulator